MADGRFVRLAFARSIRLGILVFVLLVLFGRDVATAQNNASERRGAPAIPLTAVESPHLRFSIEPSSLNFVSVDRVGLDSLAGNLGTEITRRVLASAPDREWRSSAKAPLLSTDKFTYDSAGVLTTSDDFVATESAPEYKKPVEGSGKDESSDAPSWVKNDPAGRPQVGESGKEFAERLLDKKYGEGNYGKGPGSEYSKIKKYGERSFK